MQKASYIFLSMLLFGMVCGVVSAQQIILDKPVRAGDLILFQDLKDSNSYYYLSDKPKLAVDEEGRPEFSFIRYVENVRTEGSGSRREGMGGGIVHAVVSLAITDDELQDARRELSRINSDGEIVGPVVYKSGTFALISSFNDENEGLTEHVLGLGKAPILDGEKAAISMLLTKQGAKLLWESFKTSTPDISFSFEMEIQGYRMPQDAVIEADFDQIYKHKKFEAGIATPYLAAEIKIAFEELLRSGAIKVSQVDDDELMNSLITTAFNKLTEMMFAPLNGSGTPTLSQLTSMNPNGTSVLDRANALIRANREAERQRNRTNNTSGTGTTGTSEAETTGTTGTGTSGTDSTGSNNSSSSATNIAIVVSYEMKEVKQSGTFRVNLDKWTRDVLTTRFDENIGNMSQYMDDDLHFREVNLDDPLFLQREVFAFIDGSNASDFSEFINYVTVRMKKYHEGGDVTNDEVRIDRYNFNDNGNYYKMLYGWKNDNDRDLWMDYQYEVLWSFFGDYSIHEEFKSTTFNAINLNPPLTRRSVELTADPDMLADAKVRLVSVKIYYKVGETEYMKQASLNPAKDQLSEIVEFISPRNSIEYEYEITWRLRGNKVVQSGRQTSGESILFVDELPENEEED